MLTAVIRERVDQVLGIIQSSIDYVGGIDGSEKASPNPYQATIKAAERDFLLRQLRLYLPGVECSIERREVLPVGPSGKQRLVESRLSREGGLTS